MQLELMLSVRQVVKASQLGIPSRSVVNQVTKWLIIRLVLLLFVKLIEVGQYPLHLYVTVSAVQCVAIGDGDMMIQLYANGLILDKEFVLQMIALLCMVAV